MIAAAFSSGPAYLLQVAQAGRATDFTRDYVAAHWLSQGRPLTALDGAAGNAEAIRLGADPVLMPCGPFHLHPPPASVLIRALVPLGFRGAAFAWLLISLIALAILARVLASLLGSPPRPRLAARTSTLVFLALAAWPPTIMNIAFGQWSLLLATLVAAGWWAHERGRRGAAIAAFAAAVTLKSTPAVALGFFALRDRPLLLRVLAAIVLTIALSWPVVGGIDAWRAFLRDGQPCVVCWEAYVDNTVSINGILARLLVGGRYVLAPFKAPGLAHTLGPLLGMALVIIAAVLTHRGRSNVSVTPATPTTPVAPAVPPTPAAPAAPRLPSCPSPRDAVAFAMWAALVALLNPLSWTHNALFFLLPAVLVFRHASRRAVRIAVGAALVVLSIPRETLFWWAAPVPFPPSRAWVLGVHALAGLTLFVCAALESIETSRRPDAAVGASPSPGARTSATKPPRR